MKPHIIVFSDAHYADNWDTIDQCLQQDHRHSIPYLNPNEELRRFVDTVNHTPGVEAVINNGDATDYHFADFLSFFDLLKNSSKKKRLSNPDLFNKAICRLNKPYMAVCGNHDYRKEAYNYNIWGTDHVNLSKDARKKHKDRVGHQTFRGALEAVSIMVDENRFDPLGKTLFLKKREDTAMADYHCIFMDSGSDAFVRPGNFIQYFLKVVRTGMISYDSDGLNKADLRYLETVLSKDIQKDILIFVHAPLINAKKSHMGKKYQLSIDRFDTITRKQKISYSTLFNGGGQLLKLLRETKKNIVLVSSHIHAARYFLIDKKSLVARQVSNHEFNSQKNNNGVIKQLTTLPLGGINSQEGHRKTGFLKIYSDEFAEQVLHNYE